MTSREKKIYVRTKTGACAFDVTDDDETLLAFKTRVFPRVQSAAGLKENENLNHLGFYRGERLLKDYQTVRDIPHETVLQLDRRRPSEREFATVPKAGAPRQLGSVASRRLIRELKRPFAKQHSELVGLDLTKDTLESCEYPATLLTELPAPASDASVAILSDIFDYEFTVPNVAYEGKQSPYRDGVFHIRFQLPPEYPFKPPCIQFLTPVLHPFVRPDGSVLSSRVGNWWTPATFVFGRYQPQQPGKASLLSSIIEMFVVPPNLEQSDEAVARFARIDKIWESHIRQSVELYAVRGRSWTLERNRVFPARIRDACSWIMKEAPGISQFPLPVLRLILSHYADSELDEFGRDAQGNVDLRALVDESLVTKTVAGEGAGAAGDSKSGGQHR